jgi:hypothetical protein
MAIYFQIYTLLSRSLDNQYGHQQLYYMDRNNLARITTSTNIVEQNYIVYSA